MKAKEFLKTFRSFFDSDRIQEVMSSLAGNKSRTVLTAFGIFWGVFILILLLGGGKGLQAIMMSNFGGFASNSGIMYTNNTTMAYKGYAKVRAWSFEMKDVQGLKNYVGGIDAISPLIVKYGKKATYGKKTYSSLTIKGMFPDYFKIDHQNIKYGRTLNDGDINSARKVCVIGKRVYEELFPGGGNPCGKYIKADGVYFEIVGLDTRKSNMNIGAPSNQSIVVPYTVMQRLYNTGESVGLIALTAKRGVTVKSLENPVRMYMAHTHNLNPNDRQAMSFFNFETIFQMFDNLFRGINILVWLIGIGTLISGVIGVTNIMLVSIRERTVEIGIRRAIGAKPRDILMQILTESEIMTLLAGLSGIIVAVAILAVAEPMIQQSAESAADFQVPFGVAFGAALALTLLGGLAGVFPAVRALAIKPVDAMRDE